MDRKDFMRDVYWKFWITARERKYGFLEYDKHVCELLRAEVGSEATLLEVAIGTGYPIADFLQREGHTVHGVDISPALVQRCLQINPYIVARVGDAEKLDYPDETFDGAYCFHSTFFIPDVSRAISEMLRVTRPGGTVAFDIQNRANPSIADGYDARVAALAPDLLTRTRLYARNAAKVVLRRGNPNFSGVDYEVPTYPSAVREALRSCGVTDVKVFARNENNQSLIPGSGGGDFPDFPRLVFVALRPAVIR